MSTDSDASNQHLQMQQEVTGDRNQVIGQMLGGVVINQLTIHERIPEPSLPPPISTAKPLTQQEYRQRKVLLNKVKEYWVKGVLETSLHARALIALGLQERPDLVQRPFSGVKEFAETPGQVLPNGIPATTVFDQMEAGRTLLILGEPGSGKTITLLKLAEDLIARTETDFSQPIPVVFNLSSWARKPQSIKTWLIQELLEKYQVSKALGKTWVETEALILLLDGLDEVKAEQRSACVQALNQFMQTYGTTELTICCRIKDYQALAQQLMLRSAVCIQPLTLDQIDHYVDQVGEQLNALKTALHQDEELQALAQSPLMLSIMTLAYQGCAVEEIKHSGTIVDYRHRLFDAYIERMFQRRSTTQRYSRMQTQHWLIWLAQRMTKAAQTVFLIERLQPGWLQTSWQRLCYRLMSSVIGILIVACASSILTGVVGGLYGALWGGLTYGFRTMLVVGVLFGLAIGMGYGLGGGFLLGIIYGIVALTLNAIQPVETLRWSGLAAKQSFWQGALFGLVGGLLLGLLLGFFPQWFSNAEFTRLSTQMGGFTFGLLIGIMYGLFFAIAAGGISALLGGFRGGSIQTTSQPNQGIWSSVRNAITLSLAVGVVIEAIAVLIVGGLTDGFRDGLRNELVDGIVFALTGAVMGGLLGGGSACIRHITLRLMLYCLGYSPWNYAHFLNDCTDRLFLQKVGGGYIFVHRMLLEHFAAMSLERGGR
ncbi:NACHT domain-containing protein [Oscillatoria sp. FACHB-1407]|uniref:NACHT domain-containing protein n=1 Tax=Oscillatoria sp. FACHB-1407 TaxID=2692847 RepID=UPI001682ACFC|nr:NACHT domain-containing protein [Oscillatoria sp. FACHB-1407]MBD2461747.1 NACHT domain-containing protein [Oscillatoria sp. FACHB-1407]